MDGLTLGHNPMAAAAATALQGALSTQASAVGTLLGAAGQGDPATNAVLQSSMQERGIGQKLDTVV